jgi:cyclopropane fatty-acyl-phospholipid synthase-like methyltransferase
MPPVSKSLTTDTPKSQADQGAAGQESPPRDQIGASPEAISAHYDVGEEFFQLWLGPELVYSCAMFDGTDDLATAQRRKLDFHIEAAGAAGAGRVLDIGCGWGRCCNASSSTQASRPPSD